MFGGDNRVSVLVWQTGGTALSPPTKTKVSFFTYKKFIDVTSTPSVYDSSLPPLPPPLIVILTFFSVLRILDVYPGSRIMTIINPGSRILTDLGD